MSTSTLTWPASRILLVAGGVTASLVLFTGAALATGFVMCGISGCSGGGYGAAYSPGLTQVLVLLAGLTILPAVVVLTWRRPRDVTVAVALPAVVATCVLALHLTGAGWNGCPRGMERTAAGAAAFDVHTTTCARRER